MPIGNSASVIKSGASCPYQNENRIYKGRMYNCIKVGKKWVWDKGEKTNERNTPAPFIPEDYPTPTPPVSNIDLTPKIPKYLTVDLRWYGECGSPVALQIFDGGSRLVGTPDVISLPANDDSGFCTVTYYYSNLALTLGPLVFKYGRFSWAVSQSRWTLGKVTLFY